MDSKNIPAWIAAASAALMVVMVFFGGFATEDDLEAVGQRIDAVAESVQELRDELRELRQYFIAHLERTAPPESPGQ